MRKKRRSAKARERRGIYILPNLFTSASLFGGFYAIIATIQGRYEAAAIAIIISAVFDGLDGRIARYTNTTSQFGSEYDSLADLVAFGLAPAILAYKWALEPFGRLGWLAAFVYVVCGALRLARFNVQKGTVDPGHFRGLPIPAAACMIASLVLFTGVLGGIPQKSGMAILVMIYVLSFFMVSTIRFTSFKKLDIGNRKPFHVLVTVILVFIVIAYKPKIMLFFIMLFYVMSGPLSLLYRLQGRRSHAKEKNSSEAAVKEEKESQPPAE